jgi:hypothetical protein
MYANFSARTVKKVCADTPARVAGSEEELKAQQFMAAQVGDAADEVTQEEFKVSPKAYLGWLSAAGVLLLIATAVNIVNLFVAKDVPYASFVWPVCCLCLVVIALGEYRLCKPVVDGFYKKSLSHNVYCVRKAAGETKRRIVFEGGADSAYERRYHYLGGSKFVAFIVIYPVVGVLYNVAISVLTLIRGEATPLLLWISLAFVPGYVLLLGFMNHKVVSDGANYNLTGCMTGAAVLKFMGDNDIRFENTEVVALFCGAEKTGVRGAQEAAKAHSDWKDGNVETVVISFGNIKNLDALTVCTSDLHGGVKHDGKVAALLQKAAEYTEVTAKTGKCPYGVSGAAPFAKAGVKTGLVTAVETPLPESFNTREDKADTLELRAIEKAVGIALEAAFRFDEAGLA